MADLLFGVVLTVFVTLALASIPVVLHKLGVFKALGQHPAGAKLAAYLGSNEPTDFARGMVVVLFFVGIGYLYLSGITTAAIQYQLHEPAILEMERCQTDFTAIQTSFGNWKILCNNYTNTYLANYTIPLTNPTTP